MRSQLVTKHKLTENITWRMDMAKPNFSEMMGKMKTDASGLAEKIKSFIRAVYGTMEHGSESRLEMLTLHFYANQQDMIEK